MKSKLKCELCEAVANMYCDSDRASLCWRCDNKVHGANFLVAKHSRTVLCHRCQALTPWAASGPILPPSMSLCLSCVATHCHNNHTVEQRSVQSQVRDDDDEEGEDEAEEDDYCTDDEEGEDENENQVVPLTTLANGVSLTPPSMESSGCCSSSSNLAEEEDNDSRLLTTLPPVSLKRSREIFLTH